MTTMGQRIRNLRLANRMTLEELGEKLGVNRSAISKWELGETKNIKREHVEKMARLFEVPPAWLVGFDDMDEIDRYSITLVDDDGEALPLTKAAQQDPAYKIVHEKTPHEGQAEQAQLNRLAAYQKLIIATQNVKPENYEKAIKLLQVLSE